MADYRLVGKNFTPPDMVAKVTGAAKYAEDFRAEGMLHAKLLLSPMPHARVRNIDTSAAMKMKGVVAIITPDDVPQFPPPVDPILYKEATFAGAPILAVAAETEEIAAAAIEAIKVDFEQLKHTVDPLDSLFPGGVNAFSGGNVANVQLPLQTIKWTAQDFQGFDQGKMPMGKPAEEWSYGDLEAGFKKAKVVIERSFQTAGTSHHSMEPRSNMSYWQNGKCYVHGSMQSQSFVVPNIARYLGITPQDVVFIAEYCGGGFGSKGTGYTLVSISGHLSKKANGRPVDASRLPRRGIPARLWPCRLPGLRQDRLRPERPYHRVRRVRGAGQRPEHGLLGLPQLRPCHPALLPAGGDALARHRGADQHAAARPAARAGREPDRLGDRADDRRGGETARNRPPGDPPRQRAGQ